MTSAIVLASGPTEIIMAAFLLRQLPVAARLIIYGAQISLSERLKAETLTMARLVFPWTAILDASAELNQAAALPISERGMAASLVRQFIGGETSLILTHSPDKLPERAVLDAFPDAAIITYDNGLYSHLPRSLREDNSAWKETTTINGKDFARIEDSFYFLGGILPVPPPMASGTYSVVDRKKYSAHLESLKSAFAPFFRSLVSAAGGRPVDLLLGTSYYRIKIITHAEESRIYSEYARSILADESAFVIFKDHPRANDLPLLAADERIAVANTALPVEMLPLFCNVRSSASIGSTALLTLSKLFDIPPFVLGRTSPPSKIAHVKLLMDHIALQP